MKQASDSESLEQTVLVSNDSTCHFDIFKRKYGNRVKNIDLFIWNFGIGK